MPDIEVGISRSRPAVVVDVGLIHINRLVKAC